MRYNLTKEGLINRYGNVTDAVMTKASTFIKAECIKIFHKDDELIMATCVPLAGYNKTTYTIRHIRPRYSNLKHTLSCNCQWATMTNRVCSHLLGYMIENGIYDNYEVKGGVR